MSNTILEFNEVDQIFHFNNGRNKENSFGYKTLKYCLNDYEATLFADFLQVQFIETKKKVSFKEAKRTVENLEKFLSYYNQIKEEGKLLF